MCAHSQALVSICSERSMHICFSGGLGSSRLCPRLAGSVTASLVCDRSRDPPTISQLNIECWRMERTGGEGRGGEGVEAPTPGESKQEDEKD